MRIVHVGAWNRNWGDAAIQLACRVAVGGDHEWLPYDCQTTVFTRELVEEIEKDGPCVWLVGGGGLIWWKPELDSVSGWQWQITGEAIKAIRGRIVVWAVGSPIFPNGDLTWEPSQPWAGVLRASLSIVHEAASTFTVRGLSTQRLLAKVWGDYTPIVPDIAWALVDHERQAEHGNRIGLAWATDKLHWRWGDQFRTAAVAVVLADEIGDAVNISHLSDAVVRQPDIDLVGAFARQMYAGLRCVVSARKHGIILAAAMGVPVVGIGDVTEVREICETIGAPCLPAEWLLKPGRISEAVERAVADKTNQQKRARIAGATAREGLSQALNKAWGEIE